MMALFMLKCSWMMSSNTLHARVLPPGYRNGDLFLTFTLDELAVSDVPSSPSDDSLIDMLVLNLVVISLTDIGPIWPMMDVQFIACYLSICPVSVRISYLELPIWPILKVQFIFCFRLFPF